MNSAAALLQGFRRICVLCPHCSSVSRLSDTTPYYRGKPPATPWDQLEKLSDSVQRAHDRLDADRDAIRRREVARGRREMRRRLDGLTRFYRKRRISLDDLKLVFDPVDYVAFRGLGERQCTSIEFIDCEATSRSQERIQRSLSHALEAGNISWVTMRVADDGSVKCTS